MSEAAIVPSRTIWSRLGWVWVYAIAMGLLEAICVIYLRRQLPPEAVSTGLWAAPLQRVPIELIREACTLVMLLAVAWLAGFNVRSRWAYFFFAFGVWDILYYVGLKWLAGWPASWLTWDCLFLIPVPWYGPVLAPVLGSAYLVLAAVAVLGSEQRATPARLGMLVPSQLLTLGVWIWSFVKNTHAISTRGFQGMTYSWSLFALGLLVGVSGLLISVNGARQARARSA